MDEDVFEEILASAYAKKSRYDLGGVRGQTVTVQDDYLWWVVNEAYQYGLSVGQKWGD